MRQIRQRLGETVGVPASAVMIYPTGMTGIYALHRTLCELRQNQPSVQFGFPYVDTLKVLEKFGCSSTFFETGDDHDLARLDELMQSRSIAAVFTEVPSNPLLLTPDLPALAAICRRHRTPLVVDDTIATAVNVDLLQYADVICTSLTKFFSGQGDVAAGAVVINPQSPWAEELTEAMRATGDTPLFAGDAKVLLDNSGDWITRVRQINANAEQLADHLAKHPAVARVHYPKFCTRERYDALRKPDGGYGGLMSIELHEPATNAPRFYDRLRSNKGPNLGTNYTLVCPYTILAHFDELAWAESCGVSRWLVRISVGLEDIEDLTQRFDEALGAD
jgi:cystathionine gamma-synthase